MGGISPASFRFVAFLAVAAFPQTDLTVPLLIGAAVSVLTALTYAQLVTTLPRSGGDYVYSSRVFSPWFGAALGGASSLFSAWGSARFQFSLPPNTFPTS
jgi:amino acid transporter